LNTTFNPSKKLIKNRYQTVEVSGITSANYPLATLTSGGTTWTQGYVFVPYIMVNADDKEWQIQKKEWQIQKLRIERKEKLEKLNKLN
jgi:hypothetical protein